MQKIKRYSPILFIIVSVFLTACFNPFSEKPDSDTEKQETASNESGETETAENETAGICANEYYPVNTEMSRTYKITGAAPANYVLTQSLSENSFSENRKFDSDTEITTNWSCTEDGLRHAEYNSGIKTQGSNMTMETLESSGLTLPREWTVGKKWAANYKIRTKMEGVPNAGASGTIKIDNEIVSLDDKIKIAAGEFEAAKVNTTVSINMSIGAPVNIQMTNWYVKGIGLAKQEVNSPFGGQQKVEYTGEK